MATPGSPRCREESRHGTHECARYIAASPSLALRGRDLPLVEAGPVGCAVSVNAAALSWTIGQRQSRAANWRSNHAIAKAGDQRSALRNRFFDGRQGQRGLVAGFALAVRNSRRRIPTASFYDERNLCQSLTRWVVSSRPGASNPIGAFSSPAAGQLAHTPLIVSQEADPVIDQASLSYRRPRSRQHKRMHRPFGRESENCP